MIADAPIHIVAKEPGLTVRAGYGATAPRLPRGCHKVTTRVTVAARMLGVKSMVTYWCDR